MSWFLQDFLGKSDPYLQFSRQMPDGRLQVVHRTEVVNMMSAIKVNTWLLARHQRISFF